jgi:hypothetical protein
MFILRCIKFISEIYPGHQLLEFLVHHVTDFSLMLVIRDVSMVYHACDEITAGASEEYYYRVRE